MSTSKTDTDMELRKSIASNETIEEQELANLACTSTDSEEEEINPPETNAKEETEDNYADRILNEMEHIRQEVEKLEVLIEEFCGEKKDEQYRKLDETLMQFTIRLDNIETKDIAAIKMHRRNIIMYIQNCFKKLDSKVSQVSLDLEQEI